MKPHPIMHFEIKLLWLFLKLLRKILVSFLEIVAQRSTVQGYFRKFLLSYLTFILIFVFFKLLWNKIKSLSSKHGFINIFRKQYKGNFLCVQKLQFLFMFYKCLCKIRHRQIWLFQRSVLRFLWGTRWSTNFGRTFFPQYQYKICQAHCPNFIVTALFVITKMLQLFCWSFPLVKVLRIWHT